jgi:hypothetical protein
MTAQELLNDIDLRLPNKFATANKIGWINSCLKRYEKWFTSTSLYPFNTTDGEAYYDYPTGMEPERIQKLEIASSASSTTYSEYSKAGMNDDLSGLQWFNEATTDGMQLRIYPTPSTTVEVKVYYEAAPTAVANSSDTLDIADELTDLLKYNVMKTIAQSGAAPDIDLANDYWEEEKEEFRNIKMNYYHKKQKLPKQTKTYKRVYWSGF